MSSKTTRDRFAGKINSISLAACLVAAASSSALMIAPPSVAASPDSPPIVTPAPPPPASQPATEKLEIAGEEFKLEIAATPESRELGLMDRDSIDADGGMIFIYPWPQTLSFWMKNCPIEMDILFVNDKGVIVAMHRMKPAPPRKPGQSDAEYDDALPRYESRRPAQFAIELKAGTIERLKIKPGDKIEMDVRRLTALAETVAKQP